MFDFLTLPYFSLVLLLLLAQAFWIYRLTRALAPTHRNRVILPMSSGIPVKPKQSAQITARPHGAFLPERMILSNPEDWVINDIKVGGVSQFSQSGDVPGEMFGDGQGACAFLPMTSGVSMLPDTSARISSRWSIEGQPNLPPDLALRLEQIVIANADQWVINDLKIGHVSQCAGGDDVPGVAFSGDAVGTRVQFDPLRVRIDASITVTYVGNIEQGAPFVCGVAGNFVRASA